MDFNIDLANSIKRYPQNPHLWLYILNYKYIIFGGLRKSKKLVLFSACVRKIDTPNVWISTLYPSIAKWDISNYLPKYKFFFIISSSMDMYKLYWICQHYIEVEMSHNLAQNMAQAMRNSHIEIGPHQSN